MQMVEALRRLIERHGGWIPFSDFMRFALYEPGLGYYAAGAQKFGAAGDFITAPTLSPLFGRTVARAVASRVTSNATQILELGAGNGHLALDVLSWFSLRGLSPRYAILELSAELRARQEEKLALFAPQVTWISQLPERIEGIVLGNEVLDAVPCERVIVRDGAHRRSGVSHSEKGFVAKGRTLDARDPPALKAALARIPLEDGYYTEVNIEAEALVHTVTQRMGDAVALWFDYGFPRSEYYHAQRREGTLMCHVQHRTHSDVFFAPGLQDITAHIDFTAMAEAARSGGASQIAYVSQAQWLLDAGLLDELVRVGEPGSAAYLAATNAVNTLVSPAEMGELFKVLVVQRGDGALPLGFSRDQSMRL